MFATTSETIKASPTTYPLEIDEDMWTKILTEVATVLGDDQSYPKKFRTGNFFKKPSKDLKRLLDVLLGQYPETQNLTWHFEIFNSVNPVGLHNDRNLFLEHSELCEMGMIIPLEIKGGPHLTRFYDLFIPKKVNWDGEGNFRTLEKIIEPHNPEALSRFSDVIWEKGKILFFDATQVHEAKFPEEDGSFKLSLNGLGYSHYPNPKEEI